MSELKVVKTDGKYRIIYLYANGIVEGKNSPYPGDIYTNVPELRKEHPVDVILVGYGVVDEAGICPPDSDDFYPALEMAEDYIKNTKTINKLVRDKIPEIIQKENPSVLKFHSLDMSAYRRALIEKLIEEATELLNAETEEQQIEEMADVMTVVDHLQGEFVNNLLDIQETYKKKAAQKGMFANRYIITEYRK